MLWPKEKGAKNNLQRTTQKARTSLQTGGGLMCSGGSGRMNSFFSTRDTRKSCCDYKCCNEYKLLFSDDERDKCEDMIYVIIYF
jgi:hypothetical protein